MGEREVDDGVKTGSEYGIHMIGADQATRRFERKAVNGVEKGREYRRALVEEPPPDAIGEPNAE